MPMMGFNPWDPGLLNAQVAQEGNRLNYLGNQQGNLLNRLSAYERNYIDHDLGLRNARAAQTQADAAMQRVGVDSTLGRLNDETNRLQIGTNRSNILDQLASQDWATGLNAQTDYLTGLNNANANAFGSNRAAQASEYGAGLNYQSNLLNSLTNLAGTRYASDRGMQGQLGSAALSAQANMFAPALQQQRFATIAPLVGQVLGGLTSGMSSSSSSSQ